jgi:hypothetical protein
MKAVFPWQKCDISTRVSFRRYFKEEYLFIDEEWYRGLYSKDFQNIWVAYIGCLKNHNKSFYFSETYTTLFAKYTRTEFNTLEAAKSHIDEQLKHMNIKLLPEHMLLLK